jgi:peptide/nickel transport system substrate-binding protein
MSETENLRLKLARGEITRREFISRMIALGVATTATGALWSGPALAAQKKGGHFRIGKAHGQTTDTLNPGTFENGFTIGLTNAINGYLTEIGKDGSVQPGLAESWQATPDAAEWSFKLRKGIVFHNGKPVTVDDVIASLNFHRGEKSTSAAGPLVAEIKDIKAGGVDTVVFKLAGGNADFPFTVSDYHLAILPASGDSIDWASGIGCGVYQLDKLEPGISAMMTRFPGHWATDRGFFDSIEMLALVDTNARTTALLTGDVAAIDRVDLKTVNMLKRQSSIRVNSVAGNQHYTFAMSCNQDPFTDVNVRLALKYAVDREELVEKILQGYGVVGNDHPIGRGQRYFNKDLKQRTYDPDKSKYHLKKAGRDSLQVSLSAADAAFSGAVDAAVLFQNSAKKAGIDLKVVREPNDGYWSDVWMKKPFSAVYWGGRPVEDAMFSTAYKTGVSWNDTFWSNARFDELLIKARAELDEDKRRKMYYEMQEILNRDGGAIIPMFASYVFATSDKIDYGGEFASNWDLDGERWAERWSFA